MKIVHYLHGLSRGGTEVHVTQLLKDFNTLGHEANCYALQDGEMREEMENNGTSVYLCKSEEHFLDLMRKCPPDVIHGHSCGGGSYACKVAREVGCVGGEHIHSVVPGDNKDADFEIAEIQMMKNLRPRIDIIPWAVPEDRLKVKISKDDFRETYNIPKNAFVVGRHGRLDGSKLPDHFVKALSMIPDAYGILSGWGPERARLEAVAGQLGCYDRIRFLGGVSNIGDIYNAIDVVLYPTSDDSWCAGVAEPLLCGKAVVSYPVGGIPEHIIHGKTGILTNSVDGLVRAANLLRTGVVARDLMGHLGKKLMLDKGAGDTIKEAQRHLDIYERCFG